MIIFIKNISWFCLSGSSTPLSIHPSVSAAVHFFMSLFYHRSMYAFHLAANEREMERWRREQTEKERWPLVLQSGEMNRCGKEMERGKQRLSLPSINIWSLKWSLQSSCLQPSPPLCLSSFFYSYNSSHIQEINWITTRVSTEPESFCKLHQSVGINTQKTMIL